MNPEALAGELAAEISRRLRRSRLPVPIGVSGRHAHVSSGHLAALFGPGAGLSRLKELKQPGQFAAREKIDIAGPKGIIRGVRLLGPARAATQVEVSLSDAAALGLEVPVRESGDLSGSAPLRLIGPQGSVEAAAGLIVARRHLHCSRREAAELGVADGEVVRARLGRGAGRETVFEQVLVRVSDRFALELHIDTDE
ncbi:MAG: phosphate propanoyltransferase, partial [Elusimicrobia bacterium]|nr:phosphate propanoyltransferase [Elusimicrobiota bacterium]